MSTRCDECSRDFPHPRALTQHFKSATIHIGCYCDDCNRIFIHPAALQQHYNMSSAHRSRSVSPPRQTRSICPQCRREFPRHSSMASHLENGDCSMGQPSRNQVRGFVERIEENAGVRNLVTTRMLTYGDSTNSYGNIGSRQLAERCYNMRDNCYDCPHTGCSREFSTSHNLAAHLNSSQHVSTEFKCPGCEKEFYAVNGLFTHWEYGCRNMDAARRAVNILGGGMQRLTY
ncbi:hypothetical protein HDU80_009692 [Chytriomyces hyalinus]|nr:hypothetical protein HDU80_009692 [Chytriomyces hyalinus]